MGIYLHSWILNLADMEDNKDSFKDYLGCAFTSSLGFGLFAAFCFIMFMLCGKACGQI